MNLVGKGWKPELNLPGRFTSHHSFGNECLQPFQEDGKRESSLCKRHVESSRHRLDRSKRYLKRESKRDKVCCEVLWGSCKQTNALFVCVLMQKVGKVNPHEGQFPCRSV